MTFEKIRRGDRWERFGMMLMTVQVGEFQLLYQADRVELWSFEIYPPFRGRGYSHTMLTEAIDHVSHARPKMWLAVKTSNTQAIRLYEAHGFVVTARHPVREELEMEREMER